MFLRQNVQKGMIYLLHTAHAKSWYAQYVTQGCTTAVELALSEEASRDVLCGQLPGQPKRAWRFLNSNMEKWEPSTIAMMTVNIHDTVKEGPILLIPVPWFHNWFQIPSCLQG